MFRNSGGEEIAKNKKSHFCDNLVPARPENFWSGGVKLLLSLLMSVMGPKKILKLWTMEPELEREE